MSDLWDPIFAMGAVATATDDRAWAVAMCEAETALARACARAGLIELATAAAIATVSAETAATVDLAELGRRAVAGGNPAIPLVDLIRDRVRSRAGAEAAAAVHLGATSQDIVDTATMLIAKRSLRLVIADLACAADAAAELASAHRDAPMAGRTLLQLAVPTTFGALAAVWGAALDRAVARLSVMRSALPVQLGGAAGTLSGWHPHGFVVLAAFADELGLAAPDGVWHSDRSVVIELAGALGQAAASVAKVATDIVLLAQGEVGELREDEPGGSSTMAHKQNPIAAVTARAAAAQAPGLTATLLAVAPELQRGAGSWHGERAALTALLRAVGGAAARLCTSLSGLHVDTDAMRRNNSRLGDGDFTFDTGHAADLVERYLERRKR